jgi:hypothetical protein
MPKLRHGMRQLPAERGKSPSQTAKHHRIDPRILRREKRERLDRGIGEGGKQTSLTAEFTNKRAEIARARDRT